MLLPMIKAKLSYAQKMLFFRNHLSNIKLKRLRKSEKIIIIPKEFLRVYLT